MSDESQIEEAPMCFACGQDNPVGLKIKFELNDGQVTAEFTPDENHVGFRNTVHGGIIYSALDDVMANVLYLQNRKAHTARCEIRYRQALETGQTVKLKGWIENERRRLVVLKGEMRLAGSDALVADAEASFMLA
ncbi:MAG: PaaI family thioesterase [Gammaproteobacteria bacterium]|nr:PaaI family thioesterase [Gammaproteobacteria bacterium]